MAQINHSTIVQLLFCTPPRMNFAGLVTELETALEQASAGRCDVNWDHDDIVMFEADGCRFILAYSQQPAQKIAACLTLAVGPADGFHDGTLPILTEAACRMIIDRLDLRYGPDQQQWHTLPGAIGADEIDALNEALANADTVAEPTEGTIVQIAELVPMLTLKAGSDSDAPVDAPLQEAAPVMALPMSGRRFGATRRQPADRTNTVVAPDRFERALVRKLRATRPVVVAEVAVAEEIANDRPDLPSTNDAVIARVRAALYPPVEQPVPASNALRLAAHSMDATLIVVALPVGAAMLTYSLLRGGNANVSGRIMAITCTVLALTQIGLSGQFTALL